MIETLQWLAILTGAAFRERGNLEKTWLCDNSWECLEEVGSPATPEERPSVLGGALSNPAPVAKGLALGQGRHGGRLAAEGLPDLLGLDFAAQADRK
jgi:hypothetical protein